MSECGGAAPGAFGYIVAALKQWGSEHRAPVSMTYELTPYCNFRCPMCYVRLTPEQARARGTHLTTEQWLEVIRQSKEMGTLNVNITGGEPLLHPGFWDIYEAAIKSGMFVTLLSNGSLIDEDAVERFRALPPQGIVLSLYGASDETYETMCGVKDGFTRIDRAIDLLKEAGIRLSLSIVVVRENRGDLEAMLQYADAKGVRCNHVEGIASSARGADTHPLESRLTAEIPEDFWTLERLEKKKHRPMNYAFETCSSYGGSAVITWHGHMQFCAYVDKQYAPLTFPLDLRAVWRQMLADTEKIAMPKDCATCEAVNFCEHCPGLLTAESGDPETVSPAFCERPKKLAALYRRRLAEAQEAQNRSKTTPKTEDSVK